MASVGRDDELVDDRPLETALCESFALSHRNACVLRTMSDEDGGVTLRHHDIGRSRQDQWHKRVIGRVRITDVRADIPDALAGLVRLLAECLAPDHGAGPDEVVRTCLEPLFGDEADLQLFCNTAAVFMAPPKDAGQGRKGPAWIHRNVKQRGPQSGSVDSALPDGESGSGLLRPFYFPFKVCNFLINSGKLCCYTVVEFFKLIRDVFDTVKEVAGNTFIAVKSEPGKIGLKLKKIIRMARYCLILIWLRIFISYLLVRTIRENLFKQDL